MSVFSDAELAYLAQGRLGRLATIDAAGMPHVVPLGWLGFDLATAQEYENSTVIIRNADGFHLALCPVGHVEPPPALG